MGRLTDCREQAGLSVGQVAKILQRPPADIKGMEEGTRVVSLYETMLFSKLYGVSSYFLEGGEPRDYIEFMIVKKPKTKEDLLALIREADEYGFE